MKDQYQRNMKYVNWLLNLYIIQITINWSEASYTYTHSDSSTDYFHYEITDRYKSNLDCPVKLRFVLTT